MSSPASAILSHKRTSLAVAIGIRLLAGAAAIGVIAWAYASPSFRDAEGFLRGSFCLPLSACAALLAVAVTAGRPWSIFGRWLALALVGQAAALQMIDAGTRVHYQHYRAPAFLLSEPYQLPAGIIILQAVIVAIGLGKRAGRIGAWLRRSFRVWQLAAILSVFLGFSATVSREIGFYAGELLLASCIQTISLANILLAAWSLPREPLAVARKRLARVLPAVETPGEPFALRLDGFAAAMALLVTALAAALSFYVYERHPHVPDEVTYLYQARYFAEGMLSMPPPAPAEAFNLDLMTYKTDRWFAPTPPGWAAVLAIGVVFGAAWLVNPVLAGANILLAYSFLREIYSRSMARLAVLLLSTSPWFVWMGVNFMTHTFTLTCALVVALGLAVSRRAGSRMWAFAAGIATGIGAAVRPLDGLIVAALAGIFAAAGGRRLKPSAIAALLLGTALAGGIALPYNHLLTGSFAKSPIMAYADQYYGQKSNDYGFGPQRGLGWPLDPYPGHSPFESLINANLNGSVMNTELLGWSTGSLLLMAILLFAGPLQGADRAMLLVMAAVFAAYGGYWFSGGPDFGARYWYLMIVPCAVLSARGLHVLSSKLESSGIERARASAAMVVLVLMALTNFFPWRALDKYRHYLQMRADIPVLAARHNFGKSLVLVRGERHPDYSSAAVYNPIDLKAAQTIYAWDRNPAVRHQVLEAYPGRPVWIVEGPTITGAGFRVAAGPVTDRSQLTR
jgi:hypothetical protein